MENYIKRTILLLFLFISLHGKSQNLQIQQPIKFLALGDSYTIGTSVSSQDSWPVQFTEALKNKAYQVDKTEIIAQNGWTTANLINSINTSKPEGDFNLVSLLIGVNNQFRGGSIENYEIEFLILLEKAIELAGSTDRVFVLSIPDYGFTPFGKSSQSFITRGINEFNDVNRTITKNLGVKYFDITPLSRLGIQFPEYVAGDGLHPSGIMYGLWVETIINDIEGKLTSSESDQISMYNNNEVEVYSADNKLFYKGDPTGDLNLFIFNLSGIMLHSDIISSETDLNNLSPGIYIYQITKAGKTLVRDKIIIR